MPLIELWGGPKDGDRFDRPAPLPPEWHVPQVASPTLRDLDVAKTTEPTSYKVIRYIRTTNMTKDGKALLYRFEKPKANG